jgi:hypothetical protein
MIRGWRKLSVVNQVNIRTGTFTLCLDCDGLDRGGAARLAFILQYWSLWGCLPELEDAINGALPSDLSVDLTHSI